MVVPTISQLAQKAINDPSNKVNVVQDAEVTVKQHGPTPVWGVWNSGLGIAVISSFIFPFLGVPATLVAIFAYINYKTDDVHGYRRKRQIARRLGVYAIIIGIALMALMFACKMRGWRKHHRPRYSVGEVRPGSYCQRPDSDCYGRDLRHLDDVTLGQCQQECDWSSACLSIQYKHGECWLKYHRCEVTELRHARFASDYVKAKDGANCTGIEAAYNKHRNTDYCARTGIRCDMMGSYCHRPDSDCVGHDFKYMKADLKKCLAACDGELKCKSVQQNHNNCWLKYSTCDIRELTLADGRHDYVKRKAGGTCQGL